MKISRFAAITMTGAILSLPSAAFGHGGQYRGPGDTVPRGTSGGGGRGRGGSGPNTPGPGGPSAPGPNGPGPRTPIGGGPGAGPGGSPSTGGPRGVQLTDDLDQWQFWWEFNKAEFLQLKRRIWTGDTVTGLDDYEIGRGLHQGKSATLRPSESDLRAKIIPALKKALADASSNRDIVSSCMIALAKVGHDPSILPLLEKFLPSGDQEKQESAALAMGISALPEAIDDLLALANDSSKGRELVAKSSGVAFRTRSFACYGCGLIAHETKDSALKRKVFTAMQSILDDPRESRRDVQVAALNALRLLRPGSAGPGRQLRTDAVEYLLRYMQRSNRRVFAQVRAHAYTAIARLLGRSGTREDSLGSRAKAHMLSSLSSRNERQWIYQSAILALGQMARPQEKPISQAIRQYLVQGKNQQAKRFAAIALGQIGGQDNRSFLRSKLLAARTQTIMKPWLALGLAIIHDTERQADSSSISMDSSAADVQRVYRRTKERSAASGLAIALGIFKSKSSENDILERMLAIRNDEEAAGYHAVALGLIGYQAAKGDINTLLDKAERRDKLLTQCAIALGLLGDKQVALKLVDRLADDSNPVAVSSSLSQALGFIGDRRSIDGLVSLLGNKQLKDIPRAFAAVALGLIGDKEELPWNSKIAKNINYRANVGTLTGTSSGVLDIL